MNKSFSLSSPPSHDAHTIVSCVNNLDKTCYHGNMAYFSKYLNTELSGYKCLLSKHYDSGKLSQAFHDNCCSFHITHDKSLLYDMVLLAKPISLDGISGGVSLTHSCKFLCLPSINNFERGYYSPDVNITLFSSGYLTRCGGKYQSILTSDRNGVDFYSPNGLLLDSSHLNSANLLPISPALLLSTWFTSAPTARAYSTHINAEMRRRCDAVEDLLRALSFPTDKALTQNISLGKIPTYLTATDVTLNRQLRGPCPHQLAGKYTTPPSFTSLSPPATRPGEVVSFDINLILNPPPGGRTHEIFFVDDFTGHTGTELAYSKRTPDILKAIFTYIDRVYSINGHTVQSLKGDDEPINRSLRPLLAAPPRHINLLLSEPGAHSKQIERYTQTIRNFSTSALSSLAFIVPLQYSPLLHKDVTAKMNNITNERSYPFTPEEIVSGRKYFHIPLPFGSCHMVTQESSKRIRLAQSLRTHARYVPKVEVGVCMGVDDLTGKPLFLTSNGTIAPRTSRSALSTSFVPFGWIPKEYLPVIPLPYPSESSGVDELSDDCVLTDGSVPSLNFVNSIIPEAGHVSPTIEATLPVTPTAVQPPVVAPTNQPLTDAEQLNLLHPTVPAPLNPPVIAPSNQPPILNISAPRISSRIIRRPPLRYLNRAALVSIVGVTTSHSQTGSVTRKLENLRRASARYRVFRQTLELGNLNNSPTLIRPTPPPPQPRAEVPSVRAIRLWGEDLCLAAEAKELHKALINPGSMRIISREDIEPGAVFVRSMALFKKKTSGAISCRIPVDGSSQPADSYGDTHATTSDVTDRIFALNVALKDAYDRGRLDSFVTGCGDIPAAFINNKVLTREHTGGHQFITRLPKDLLHAEYANQYAHIIKPQYGLKQSNHIHDEDLHKLMLSHGYLAHDIRPRVYIKYSTSCDKDNLCVSFHVDDFEYYSTCPILLEQFKSLMRHHFGPDVLFQEPSTGICNVEITRHPNHSHTLSMGKYLRNVLTAAGMDSVPPAVLPSLPHLFHIDPTSPPLPETEAKHFSTINGKLVYPLPVRFDFSKEVRFLCGRNENPTQEDREKQIQLLRYIKGCPDIGPTYSPCGPPGLHIVGMSDAGHAVHPSTGASQIAYQLSVGDTNAPFFSHCSAETGSISPCTMSAEYIGLGNVAKEAVHYRQFADTLGYPSPGPSIIKQDNNSAINLTKAPVITRRSRFINIRHHFVRSLYQNNVILPVYTNTNDMSAVDMLTKSSSTPNINKFLFDRSVLFNDKAKSTIH